MLPFSCLETLPSSTFFVNLSDAGDPVESGLRYSEQGADELVFLDITASSDRREIVSGMVRDVADTINIPFTVGGGIGSIEDVQSILRAGADKVSINTAAVERKERSSGTSRPLWRAPSTRRRKSARISAMVSGSAP